MHIVFLCITFVSLQASVTHLLSTQLEQLMPVPLQHLIVLWSRKPSRTTRLSLFAQVPQKRCVPRFLRLRPIYVCQLSLQRLCILSLSTLHSRGISCHRVWRTWVGSGRALVVGLSPSGFAITVHSSLDTTSKQQGDAPIYCTHG